ncbi:phosphotransferase [Streptomyces sp. NPDC000594]|uniref:phosphotransferase enzyme family protein n=1 Tax=Streptomyces sp. NPDC000594 TaxID=3154261 RepID=UPI0033212058
MKERPNGPGAPDDDAIRAALRAWDIDARPRHLPVGFGDHHWSATAADGTRWFVTVFDLTQKGHADPDPGTVREVVGRALETARLLRARAGLDFVVASLPDRDGAILRPLGERYAVAVFPWLDGIAGEYEREDDPAVRLRTVEMLAALHRAPVPAVAPVLPDGPARRAELHRAIADAARPWSGGPFAEPAREALADVRLGEWLEEYDRRCRALRERGAAPVLTHGEPHPGNVLRQGDRSVLIDWDTVAVAFPERDLWHVAREPAEFDRYTELTGRTPDAAALALYELRWDLEDLAAYLEWFRGPHTRSADTELAWEGFARAARRLADG